VFRKYLSTLSLTAVVRAGAPRKAWWAHADEVQHTRTTAERLPKGRIGRAPLCVAAAQRIPDTLSRRRLERRPRAAAGCQDTCGTRH